jgi:hypothetical protein
MNEFRESFKLIRDICVKKLSECEENKSMGGWIACATLQEHDHSKVPGQGRE